MTLVLNKVTADLPCRQLYFHFSRCHQPSISGLSGKRCILKIAIMSLVSLAPCIWYWYTGNGGVDHIIIISRPVMQSVDHLSIIKNISFSSHREDTVCAQKKCVTMVVWTQKQGADLKKDSLLQLFFPCIWRTDGSHLVKPSKSSLNTLPATLKSTSHLTLSFGFLWYFIVLSKVTLTKPTLN